MWLAPEKNGEKDLQLSFSEFKQIGRAWGKLREITFWYYELNLKVTNSFLVAQQCKNINSIIPFLNKYRKDYGLDTNLKKTFEYFIFGT